MKNLRKENELIDLFCSLAEIPSPSLSEDNVIDWILNYCKKNNLNAETDDYRNIYINIPATDSSKQPILLSAHMDVIGDGSPISTILDGDFIHANNRTLGADDKAGIANALYFATNLVKNQNLKHGGVEIVFTRDEEHGMSGIKHVNFSKLKSKNVLVLDSDSLGQCMTSGASYINVEIEINAPKGGHSGNDITDTTRENAAKLLADIVSSLPQGAYACNDCGDPIASCNIGGIIAGDVNVTNVINTYGKVTYSVRANDLEKQTALLDDFKENVSSFNQNYEGIAKATLKITEKMPMFVNESNNNLVPEAFATAAKTIGINPVISAFHAGAETHVYAFNKNANGEPFSPYLLGLADVRNMHSNNECVDYKSILKGQELLKEFFNLYNK